MNRHSLIVYISLFFFILMGVINTLFFLQFAYEQRAIAENGFRKLHESIRVLGEGRRGPPAPNEVTIRVQEVKERIKERFGIELLTKKEAGNFIRGRLIEDRKEAKLYVYEGHVYLHFQDPRHGVELFLKYHDERMYGHRILWLATFVNLALIVFFIFVIRRIWPLRKLKQSILAFAEGDLDIRTAMKGKDEIAEVSNEFDKAIGKIKHLQSSRNLFLRNIMHELKTPIAKGKLITDLMEDEKNGRRLSQIFNRFEYLLGEFAKIERVTSNELKLEKKNFRTVDVLDNALDILMLEPSAINVNVNEDSHVEVDYELFSIAIKNLVDNALKYGHSKPLIVISSTMLDVCSLGEALEENTLGKVFNRKFEDSSKGLGLGLYITRSIVEKHGFVFSYRHDLGMNHFTITF